MKIKWRATNEKRDGCAYEKNDQSVDMNAFSESLVSKNLLEYFMRRFPTSLAPIALSKCIATISCKLCRPRVSILSVAPSRNFKSYISKEVMRTFSKEFWINLQSDFTMNSLRKYKEKMAKDRCLFVNDGTTLFASKSKRIKDRLVGGLSELLADGSYKYQDFNETFSLKGNVTLMMNMTSESYRNYKDRLLGLTFSERLFTLHHALSRNEMHEWVVHAEKSKPPRLESKIGINDIETHIEDFPSKYLKSIQDEAREFSYLSLKSYIGCQDLIKGTLRAHASLNKRQAVCSDDFKFLLMIKKHLVDPFNPYEGTVVKYRAMGMSYREICRRIGKSKNYVKQVDSFVKKAQIRGILPLETKLDQIMKNER